LKQVAQSVKIKELDSAGFFPKDDRELENPFIPGDGMDVLGVTNTKRSSADAKIQSPPPGVGTQVSLLFGREMKNLKRDTVAVGARFGLTIFLGTLIGVIFYQVGKSDSAGEKGTGAPGQPSVGNIQSHFGALIMVALMSMFGTAQPALLSFPSERPVFLREYSTNHYSTISYFLARFTVEAVITALQVLVMVSAITLNPIFFVEGAFLILSNFVTITVGGDILLNRFSCKFLPDGSRNLFVGNGKYSISCLIRLCSRRSKAWTRNVTTVVCTANVICWILCPTTTYSGMVTLGTIFVYVNIFCTINIASRI
jgi:ABC-2 type transporter